MPHRNMRKRISFKLERPDRNFTVCNVVKTFACNTIEIKILKKDASPKYGNVSATTSVERTRIVLIKTITKRKFPAEGSNSSMLSAIGVIVKAYFVNGLTTCI